MSWTDEKDGTGTDIVQFTMREWFSRLYHDFMIRFNGRDRIAMVLGMMMMLVVIMIVVILFIVVPTTFFHRNDLHIHMYATTTTTTTVGMATILVVVMGDRTARWTRRSHGGYYFL